MRHPACGIDAPGPVLLPSTTAANAALEAAWTCWRCLELGSVSRCACPDAHPTRAGARTRAALVRAWPEVARAVVDARAVPAARTTVRARKARSATTTRAARRAWAAWS